MPDLVSSFLLLQTTLSQSRTSDVNGLNLHILGQALQQTLPAQSAALPTSKRQVPAACRARAVYANHATLQLLAHTNGTLEVLGIQSMEC
jgi:hypothetical protein